MSSKKKQNLLAVPEQKGGKHGGLNGWHPEDVKAAVRKKGHTLTSLSLSKGYSESYLRSALIRPLYEAEQIIARYIGVPARQIWPDRYHLNGTSKVHLSMRPATRRAA